MFLITSCTQEESNGHRLKLRIRINFVLGPVEFDDAVDGILQLVSLYWVSGLCPSATPNTEQFFGNCFRLQVKRWGVSPRLGLLETANLCHGVQ